MAPHAEVLIVFVKHPEPGRAKTRLAPLLGDRAAARVYRRLATKTLQVAHASRRAERAIEVWVDPADRVRDAPSWIGPADAFHPQPAGDLGARMQRAFAVAFENGASRVAIVGSDLPALTAADLDDAFSALGASDAVLGPASDGGYWLVGLRRPVPELFASIAWSTPGVLAETRDRMARLGLDVRELRELSDIDRPDDFIAMANIVPSADIDRWTGRSES